MSQMHQIFILHSIIYLISYPRRFPGFIGNVEKFLPLSAIPYHCNRVFGRFIVCLFQMWDVQSILAINTRKGRLEKGRKMLVTQCTLRQQSVIPWKTKEGDRSGGKEAGTEEGRKREGRENGRKKKIR